MALVKLYPFKDLLTIQDRMNRIFDDFITRTKGEEDFVRGVWSPAVDIYETEEGIVLNAELPGINKDDVVVEVKDNTLLLKGERKYRKDIKEENFHRMERSYGTFQRSFTLPNSVDKDKVKASYKNGILKIELPKTSTQKLKQIKVEVK